MKKLLTITAIVLMANASFAQENESKNQENELKNFRFGLKVTPSVNWYKPEGKIMSGNGAGVKFGGGLILEFRLAKVISIQTGAQIDLDGGKIKYNNGGPNNPGSNTISYYYNNADDKIAKYGSVDPTASNGYTHYQLNERIFKTTYITIPLSLKMKTKEIGVLTYYGQIGVNNSIRWKASADDKVTVINDATNTLGATESKSKVDITKDVNVYTGSLNFGLGTELNISGSTSFTFGLNYNLGFTNVVKSESGYIQKRTNDPVSPSYSLHPMPQEIKTNAVILTVGILF
ncbi:MAG: PorT family protein [Bacteroidetes bacterium]|nr:PorT family protein [Bacteroidota bacterium]